MKRKCQGLFPAAGIFPQNYGNSEKTFAEFPSFVFIAMFNELVLIELFCKNALGDVKAANILKNGPV